MRMISKVWLCLFAAIFLIPTALPAQTSGTELRKFTVDDLLQLRSVHDPQMSPDGSWVAYVIGTTNKKEDKREQRIWMIPLAGGEAIALTAEGASSSHPRWSPDGRFLAFLSARHGGKSQVWLLNRLGGEAQKLTETAQDVEDFAWSPDGPASAHAAGSDAGGIGRGQRQR